MHAESELRERERSMHVQTHMHVSERSILVSFIFKNLTIKTLKELNWGYFEHHYQFMKSTDLKVKPVSSLESF